MAHGIHVVECDIKSRGRGNPGVRMQHIVESFWSHILLDDGNITCSMREQVFADTEQRVWLRRFCHR